MIRPAQPGDADRQRAVERAAGTRFADVGLQEMPAETLAAYARSGRSWVATDPDDHVVGYVVVDVIDGHAHIEQVSVEPTHQGKGLGRALIDEVEQWATAQNLEAITLTTFSDVPWNRPLYEHLGFQVIPPDRLSPGLRSLRNRETAHGLNPDLRVCMRRPITRGPAP
jgi:GNAT superfamily N-acetyltransferase